MKNLQKLPEELKMYENCKIFDSGKGDSWKTITVGKLTVGEVSIDDDEISCQW